MGSCASTKNTTFTSPKSINTDTKVNDRRYDLIIAYYRSSKCYKTISSDIIRLLAAFYDNPSTKIFCGLPGLISSSTEIVMLNMNMNTNVDVTNLGVSYLKHHKLKNDIISSWGPFCYIPDINPKKHLDGILCVRQQYNISNPVLLLFDPSNAIKSTNDNIENSQMITKYRKIQFLSSSERPQQFVYCGKENGIVCIKYGSLCRWNVPYNMDFIDMEATMHHFKEIDQLFWKSSDRIIMCYLPNKKQLFAVKQNGKIICAIFDFKNRDWKVIKNIKFNFESMRLCYDGYKMLYIVSNKGEIIGYDLNNRKWTKISVKNKEESNDSRMIQFTVWMEENDVNKIYCTDGNCLKYFDTTDNKWKMKKGYKKIFEKLGDKSVVFV